MAATQAEELQEALATAQEQLSRGEAASPEGALASALEPIWKAMRLSEDRGAEALASLDAASLASWELWKRETGPNLGLATTVIGYLLDPSRKEPAPSDPEELVLASQRAAVALLERSAKAARTFADVEAEELRRKMGLIRG
jgi:hypothetical protein